MNYDDIVYRARHYKTFDHHNNIVIVNQVINKIFKI